MTDKSLYEKPMVAYEWKVTFRGRRCGDRFGRVGEHVEYVHATCKASAIGGLLQEYVMQGEAKVQCLGKVESLNDT